jgi:hypothetical protein
MSRNVPREGSRSIDTLDGIAGATSDNPTSRRSSSESAAASIPQRASSVAWLNCPESAASQDALSKAPMSNDENAMMLVYVEIRKYEKFNQNLSNIQT